MLKCDPTSSPLELTIHVHVHLFMINLNILMKWTRNTLLTETMYANLNYFNVAVGQSETSLRSNALYVDIMFK